ncbi:hypothetical protein ACLKA7_017695, partial [Drosophila subpalustris]
IPVPDSGVPALPEMTTYTSSPSSWSTNGPSLQVLAYRYAHMRIWFFNDGWQTDRQTRNNNKMQHKVVANSQ